MTLPALLFGACLATLLVTYVAGQGTGPEAVRPLYALPAALFSGAFLLEGAFAVSSRVAVVKGTKTTGAGAVVIGVTFLVLGTMSLLVAGMLALNLR